MKINIITSLIAFALAPLAVGQTSSPASSASASAAGSASKASARTDLYHVHFANAAPGKAQALAESLKTPGGPTETVPGHFIILRHEDGDSWDFCAIAHIGAKATIDTAHAATPTAANVMANYAAHTDTFAIGPSWAEFTKALGIDENGKGGAKDAAYVVSIYRAGSGQRDALDKFLNQPPDRSSDSSAGQVLLQHVEGAAWNFVSIQRWNSWADYAKDNVASIAQMGRNQQGGWYKLRELISFHTDTLCDRLAP